MLGGLAGLTATIAGCSASYHRSLGFYSADGGDVTGAVRGDAPRPQDVPIVDRTVRDGSTTAVVLDSELRDGKYLRGPDGAFHRLVVRTVAEERRRVLEVHLENDQTIDRTTARRAGDLPTVDRRIVREAFLEEGLGAGDVQRFDRLPHLVRRVLDDDQRAASELADGRVEALLYRGRTYTVDVEWDRESVAVRWFQATQVAPDQKSFLAKLREQYRFELSGLSAAERDLVGSAVDERLGREDADGDAFDAVVERLQAHESLPEISEWLVRHDGVEYLAWYNKSRDYPV